MCDEQLETQDVASLQKVRQDVLIYQREALEARQHTELLRQELAFVTRELSNAEQRERTVRATYQRQQDALRQAQADVSALQQENVRLRKEGELRAAYQRQQDALRQAQDAVETQDVASLEGGRNTMTAEPFKVGQYVRVLTGRYKEWIGPIVAVLPGPSYEVRLPGLSVMIFCRPHEVERIRQQKENEGDF